MRNLQVERSRAVFLRGWTPDRSGRLPVLVRMNRWRVVVGHEAATATGFVHALAPHGHALFGFKSALRIICRLAALHADRVGLGYVLGDGEQLRHRFPGPAGIVLIKPGND